MSEAGRLGLGVVCLLLLLVTVPKLRKMAMIVGWLPGAHTYHATVTDTWQGKDRGFSYYNLSWQINPAEGAAKSEGNDRADYDDWKNLAAGTPVQIVAVGNEFFYSKTIYAEPGNFAFDYCLLAVELTGAVFGFGWIAKEFWQERRANR